MRRDILKTLVLSGLLGAQLEARLADNVFDWFKRSSGTVAKKYENFHGLLFAHHGGAKGCIARDTDYLSCPLVHGRLVFEKKNISSLAALSLVKLARKKAWHEQYRLINHYSEGEVLIGLGAVGLYKAVVYRLDNILWPLLLRSYDVVIDQHTCISITTECDVRDWPAFERELSSIEASLSKKS